LSYKLFIYYFFALGADFFSGIFLISSNTWRVIIQFAIVTTDQIGSLFITEMTFFWYTFWSFIFVGFKLFSWLVLFFFLFLFYLLVLALQTLGHELIKDCDEYWKHQKKGLIIWVDFQHLFKLISHFLNVKMPKHHFNFSIFIKVYSFKFIFFMYFFQFSIADLLNRYIHFERSRTILFPFFYYNIFKWFIHIIQKQTYILKSLNLLKRLIKNLIF